MLEDQFYISKLITGHLQGTLDVQQQKEFVKWIEVSESNKTFFEEFYNEAQLNEELKRYNDLDEANIWNKVVNSINEKVNASPEKVSTSAVKVRRLPVLFYKVIAAAAALILVTGLIFYNVSNPKTLSSGRYANDVLPGGNKATLTLSNGEKIVLTDAKTGTLANESNVTINKSGDGQIDYNLGGHTAVNIDAEALNVMETPKGGQYMIGLSDGTKITLNAASTLKFPASFTGKDRIVELTGEAYFQVAKDKTRPFIVKAGKEKIQVLGTHFNVNNYADEGSIKTTLLEGSVMINGQTVLKPGEQAVLSVAGIRINQVDTDLATAWKDNKFRFESEKIEDIMKMIARWYDVDVVYVGEIPDDKFGGSVSKFDKVSKVLEILELTGNVHFKIEGRRIMVTK